MDQPQYSVKPKLARALVPETIKLILLSAIFYVGILVNLSLLNYPLPLSVNLLVIAVLVVLVALELILVYLKTSKTMYQFYQDRIEAAKKSVKYLDVANPKIKRSLFDKSYNTGTIMLQPRFKLVYVENPDEVFGYIQNMIAYQTGTR